MNMKKVIKSTRLLALLAVLLFTTLVQAQIEVGKFDSYKLTVIKTYSPPPLQVGKDQLIKRFNRKFKNANLFTTRRGETIHSSGGGLKALDDRFETWSGTMFYYSDIIVDKKINIYEDKYEYGFGKSYWTEALQELFVALYEDKYGSDKSYWTVRVPVSKCWGEPCNSNRVVTFFYFKSGEDAQEFAEIMYYIMQPYRDKKLAEQLYNDSINRADIIQFSTLAAKYREMEVKPSVTEEQRKYIVQANMFNQKKEYSKAIDLYKKVIEVNATSYTAAYYNLALLEAQIGSYKKAISFMKKYLWLVPDAPDARAAQDKIYEWEAEIKN